MSAAGMQLRIIICAVEPSGDHLGAALMMALKQRAPGVKFFGCGGPMMASEGLESLFSIDSFAVIGPVGALKALPAALSGARRLAKAAREENVDAAVLIDSWSFSRLAAARIKQAAPAVKLIKYVAPQVWASRPKRAETVAKLFDGVLTLFEFENSYFERFGAAVRFVGSSTLQEASRNIGEPGAFRAKYQLGRAPILAVLPGSRKAEIRQLANPFRETIELLISEIPDLRLAIPVAPSVAADVRELAAGWPGAPVFVEADERFAAFSAADAALAASGTVTTELAITGTPMVVGYKVDPLSAIWIRSVITTPYVSLINVAGKCDIIPEFLQENCQPANMAAQLALLLTDKAVKHKQLQAFPNELSKLGIGGPPAAEAAAAAIIDWIKPH